MLSACKLYISEGRNQNFVQFIKDLASNQKGVAFLDAHVDKPYNRTGILLAAEDSGLGQIASLPSSRGPTAFLAADAHYVINLPVKVQKDIARLLDGAVNVAREALGSLDLQLHQAQHPRMGVIDHISCSPLCASEPSSAALQTSVQVARQLGTELGSGQKPVPIYLYGHASPKQTSLAEIRRALGYFQGSQTGLWKDALAEGLLQQFPPDFGPLNVPQQSGIITIGASPWITNYNLLLHTGDMQEARRIARAVSQRGGGLIGVESMALKHDEGIEVACNLHSASVSLQRKVLAAVEEQCQPRKIRVWADYIIGKLPEDYTQEAKRLLSRAI